MKREARPKYPGGVTLLVDLQKAFEKVQQHFGMGTGECTSKS